LLRPRLNSGYAPLRLNTVQSIFTP
jgi:hypothetical protein